MQQAHLGERGVVRVIGEDAGHFLQGLVTCDVEALAEGEAGFGALLTPQGKIIVDFLVVRAPDAIGGGYLLDVKRVLAADLARKLGFYKLRAKVIVEDQSDQLGVTAFWGGETAPEVGGLLYRDPRHPALGWRMFQPLPVENASGADYDAHRVAIGIPEGGRDFAYGDAFPHETDMDQLHGVSFTKGCYVGQEVVSRMQHRGTARTRIVPIGYDGPEPLEGIDVVAGDRLIGHLGSVRSGRALAKLRLDKVADAMTAGEPLTAGGIAVRVVKPDWARFAWPGEMTDEKAG
ncbi:folate-binding protein YgfZ [Phreatobacter aquaticus]|uniref:Folate-binding protein YgfZ n=1 Tax=Phreatobacter aquaticus TaxID=2570229 RepID=A0A4D7QE33_9HYPH|nr:folate-binding protein YgfZ [Phreatobacter aquaticus]QCK86260.1 folate-binding protein YgfZ [Phreatobacter aquaticus]